MSTTLTGALSTVIREEIPKGLREARIKLDPVWTDIISTSIGVERNGLGRDWKFLKTWVTGLSGAYQFSTSAILTGSNLAAPATPVDYAQFGAGNSFPGITETTAPAFFQSTVTLAEARGNIVVPVKWLQMDEFDSSIASSVKEVIKGTARKIALMHAIAFYFADSTAAVVSNLAASGSAATHSIEIDNADAAKAHGRINMLHNGMLVDIRNVTTGALVNGATTPWVVHKVDYVANTFSITSVGDSNRAITEDDYLTLRNSATTTTSHAPQGINSWMSNGTPATVLGVTIANYPIFKSLFATETGPLTEKMLNKHYGTFNERLGTLCDLDTMISSAGVLHAFLENEENLARYERNGKRLSIKAGWTDVDYAYEGNGFRWGISSFIEPGAVYFYKFKGNNIKEYVPPRTPGVGSKSEFENEIQFMAPLGGNSGIFLHQRDTSSPYGITDNLEAPFFRIAQLAPDQVQGIKITGLDETYS